MRTVSILFILVGAVHGLNSVTLPAKTKFVVLMKYEGSSAAPNRNCNIMAADFSSAPRMQNVWVVGKDSVSNCVQSYTPGGTAIGKSRKALINAADSELMLEFFNTSDCSGAAFYSVDAHTGTNTAQKYPAALKRYDCMVDPDDDDSSIELFAFKDYWSPGMNKASMAYFNVPNGAVDGGSAGCTDANIMGAQEFDCNSCFGSASPYKKITCTSLGISITSGYTDNQCTLGGGSKVLTYTKDKCYAGAAGSMLPPVNNLAWELLDCGAVTWGSNTLCGTVYICENPNGCLTCRSKAACENYDETMRLWKMYMDTVNAAFVVVPIICCCTIVCIIGCIVACVIGCCTACAKNRAATPPPLPPTMYPVMPTVVMMAGGSTSMMKQQEMVQQPQAVQAQVVTATVVA